MPQPVRTAVVTGANRGIGRAVCEALAARGDVYVVVAARRRDDAAATVEVLGDRARAVQIGRAHV